MLFFALTLIIGALIGAPKLLDMIPRTHEEDPIENEAKRLSVDEEVLVSEDKPISGNELIEESKVIIPPAILKGSIHHEPYMSPDHVDDLINAAIDEALFDNEIFEIGRDLTSQQPPDISSQKIGTHREARSDRESDQEVESILPFDEVEVERSTPSIINLLEEPWDVEENVDVDFHHFQSSKRKELVSSDDVKVPKKRIIEPIPSTHDQPVKTKSKLREVNQGTKKNQVLRLVITDQNTVNTQNANLDFELMSVAPQLRTDVTRRQQAPELPEKSIRHQRLNMRSAAPMYIDFQKFFNLDLLVAVVDEDEETGRSTQPLTQQDKDQDHPVEVRVGNDRQGLPEWNFILGQNQQLFYEMTLNQNNKFRRLKDPRRHRLL